MISWAEQGQDTLDLLIEPRSSLTRELWHYAKDCSSIYPFIIFSGLYRQGIAVEEYETILIVASGFSIIVQLPYLKCLIHGYNIQEVRVRRIRLVWQIEDKGKYPSLGP